MIGSTTAKGVLGAAVLSRSRAQALRSRNASKPPEMNAARLCAGPPLLFRMRASIRRPRPQPFVFCASQAVPTRRDRWRRAGEQREVGLRRRRRTDRP